MKSGLLVRFPDQSKSFTYGFEAGMVWERLESGKETFEMNIREENVDLVKDMCIKKGYVFTMQPIQGFEEYSWLIAFKKKTTDN